MRKKLSYMFLFSVQNILMHNIIAGHVWIFVSVTCIDLQNVKKRMQYIYTVIKARYLQNYMEFSFVKHNTIK